MALLPPLHPSWQQQTECTNLENVKLLINWIQQSFGYWKWLNLEKNFYRGNLWITICHRKDQKMSVIYSWMKSIIKTAYQEWTLSSTKRGRKRGILLQSSAQTGEWFFMSMNLCHKCSPELISCMIGRSGSIAPQINKYWVINTYKALHWALSPFEDPESMSLYYQIINPKRFCLFRIVKTKKNSNRFLQG